MRLIWMASPKEDALTDGRKRHWQQGSQRNQELTSMDCLIRSPSSQLSITVKRSPAGMPVRARISTKSMFDTVRVPSCTEHLGIHEVQSRQIGIHAIHQHSASCRHCGDDHPGGVGSHRAGRANLPYQRPRRYSSSLLLQLGMQRQSRRVC